MMMVVAGADSSLQVGEASVVDQSQASPLMRNTHEAKLAAFWDVSECFSEFLRKHLFIQRDFGRRAVMPLGS
jgi:hypothetical protein